MVTTLALNPLASLSSSGIQTRKVKEGVIVTVLVQTLG